MFAVMKARLPIRIATALAAAIATLLVTATSAMAADGVGLSGRTNDLQITYWGFAVIAFFMILPIVLSIIQGRLDSRKERAQQERARVDRP